MDYQSLKLGPNRNPLINPQAKRGEYGKTSASKNNKTDDPQSPAALEFTSTAAEVLTKEQRMLRISGFGQAAIGTSICTYNARPLSSDDRMIELEGVKWNIIGLSEVRMER